MRGYTKLIALSLMLTVMGLVRPCDARGQSNAFANETNIHFGSATQPTACEELRTDQPAKAALRLV